MYKMYGKRRYGRKRYGAKKSVRKLAKGKSSNIEVLAKAVKRLQNKDKSQPEYLNLTQQFDMTNVVAPALYQNLNNYLGMNTTFGTTADDLEANKVIHKSVGMDCYVSLENSVNDEESTIGFTAFLVSLKDDVGPLYSTTNGAITLTAGQTHEMVKGMCLLNKKIFNIHKQKRFTLSNHNTALTAPSAQNQFGTDQRWYWKLPINKTIQNPIGNWKSLQCANDPSKQYYFMLFTDNTSADLESPAVSFVAVHTFKTVS